MRKKRDLPEVVSVESLHPTVGELVEVVEVVLASAARRVLGGGGGGLGKEGRRWNEGSRSVGGFVRLGWRKM